MPYHRLQIIAPLVGFFAGIPMAQAAPPSGGAATIAALNLTGAELSPAQLAQLRGGFDISPGVSIDFSFQQIDSIAGTIVQSIIVPTVTLTSTSGPAPVVVSNGNGDTTIIPPGTANVTLGASGNQGLTNIVTTLGASGIANLVTNQANNTSVSVATTMSIGINGMSQWMTAQQVTSGILNGLNYGNALK
ncbi:hypothetical protein [Acidocella sp. KAb 2-4]|uniref:hypothetical protein n=1 Tax=Acidocella sp. KAb 2-4 TaxID=2885158 RepID=UPI001D08B32F|nr:hypothetical protein [Acidocella sp. KAb 2-4]